jgi:hypothetical protein
MADTGATDQGHASDIRSGVNVIKLFFSLSPMLLQKKLECLSTVSYFKLVLKFASKDRSLLLE